MRMSTLSTLVASLIKAVGKPSWPLHGFKPSKSQHKRLNSQPIFFTQILEFFTKEFAGLALALRRPHKAVAATTLVAVILSSCAKNDGGSGAAGAGEPLYPQNNPVVESQNLSALEKELHAALTMLPACSPEQMEGIARVTTEIKKSQAAEMKDLATIEDSFNVDKLYLTALGKARSHVGACVKNAEALEKYPLLHETVAKLELSHLTSKDFIVASFYSADRSCSKDALVRAEYLHQSVGGDKAKNSKLAQALKSYVRRCTVAHPQVEIRETALDAKIAELKEITKRSDSCQTTDVERVRAMLSTANADFSDDVARMHVAEEEAIAYGKLKTILKISRRFVEQCRKQPVAESQAFVQLNKALSDAAAEAARQSYAQKEQTEQSQAEQQRKQAQLEEAVRRSKIDNLRQTVTSFVKDNTCSAGSFARGMEIRNELNAAMKEEDRTAEGATESYVVRSMYLSVFADLHDFLVSCSTALEAKRSEDAARMKDLETMKDRLSEKSRLDRMHSELLSAMSSGQACSSENVHKALAILEAAPKAFNDDMSSGDGTKKAEATEKYQSLTATAQQFSDNCRREAENKNKEQSGLKEEIKNLDAKIKAAESARAEQEKQLAALRLKEQAQRKEAQARKEAQEKLEQEVAALGGKITQLENAKSAQDAQLAKAEKERNQLETQLQNERAEQAKLHEQIGAADKKLNAVEREKELQNQEIDALRQSIQKSAGTIEIQKQAQESLELRNREIEAKIARLESEIAIREKRIAALEGMQGSRQGDDRAQKQLQDALKLEISSLTARVKQLEQEKSAQEAEMASLKANESKQNAELASLREKHAKLIAQNGTLEDKIRVAEETKAALEAKMASLEKNLIEKDSLLTAEEAKQAKLRAETADLHEKLEQVTRERRDHEQKIARLESQEQANVLEIARYKTERESALLEANALNGKLAELEKARQSSETRLEAIEKSKSAIEAALAREKQKSDNLDQSVQKLEQTRSEQEKKISNLETESAVKQAEIQKHALEKEDARKEAAALQQLIKDTEQHKAELSAALVAEKQSQEMLKKVNAELENAVARLETLKSEQEQKIQGASDENQAVRGELAKQQRENEALKQQMKALDEKIAQLEQQKLEILTDSKGGQDALRGKLLALEKAIAQQELAKAEQNSRIAQLESLDTTNRAEIARQQQELTAAKRNSEALDAKIAQLEQEKTRILADSQGGQDALRKTILDLEAKIERNEAAKAEFESKLAGHLAEKDTASQKITALEARVSELEQQKSQLIRDGLGNQESLKKMISDLEANVSRLEDLKSKQEKLIAQLEGQGQIDASEVARFQKEKEQAKADAANLEKRIGDLERERAELVAENQNTANVKKLNQELQASITKLEQLKAEQTDRIAALERQQRANIVRIDYQRRQRETAKREAESLKQKIAELDREREKIVAENVASQEVKKRNQELETNITRLEQLKTLHEKRLEQHERRARINTFRAAMRRKERDRAKQETAELMTRIGELERQKQQLLAETEAQDALKQINADLESSINRLEQIKTEQTKRIAELEKSGSASAAELAKRKKEQEAAQAETAALEKRIQELEQMKSSGESKLLESEKARLALEANLREEKLAQDRLKQNASSLQQKISQLEQAREAQEAKIAALKKAEIDREQELLRKKANAVSQLNVLQGRMNSLLNQDKDCDEGSLARATLIIDDAERAYELDLDNAVSSGQQSGLAKNLESLLAQAKKFSAECKESVSSQRREQDSLRGTVAAMEAQLKKMQQEREDQEARLREYEDLRQKAESDYKNLLGSLAIGKIESEVNSREAACNAKEIKKIADLREKVASAQDKDLKQALRSSDKSSVQSRYEALISHLDQLYAECDKKVEEDKARYEQVVTERLKRTNLYSVKLVKDPKTKTELSVLVPVTSMPPGTHLNVDLRQHQRGVMYQTGNKVQVGNFYGGVVINSEEGFTSINSGLLEEHDRMGGLYVKEEAVLDAEKQKSVTITVGKRGLTVRSFEKLKYEKSGKEEQVLVKLIELPAGTKLSVAIDRPLFQKLSRNDKGVISYSSDSYMPVKIVERPRGLSLTKEQENAFANGEAYAPILYMGVYSIIPEVFDEELTGGYKKIEGNFKWNKANPKGTWSVYVSQALNKAENKHLVDKTPADMKKLCPNYAKLNRDQKEKVWIALVAEISYMESALIPFNASDESKFSKTLNNIFSRGLTQMSVESVQDSCYRERGCSDIKDAMDMVSPKKHLACTIGVMSCLVSKGNCISCSKETKRKNSKGVIETDTTWYGIAKYWSTLQTPSEIACKEKDCTAVAKIGKIAEIANEVQSALPFCKAAN